MKKFTVTIDASPYLDLSLGDLFTRNFEIEKIKLVNSLDPTSFFCILIPIRTRAMSFWSTKCTELDGKELVSQFKQYVYKNGGNVGYFYLDDNVFNTERIAAPILCQLSLGEKDLHNGNLFYEISGYCGEGLHDLRKYMINRQRSPFVRNFTMEAGKPTAKDTSKSLKRNPSKLLVSKRPRKQHRSTSSKIENDRS